MPLTYTYGDGYLAPLVTLERETRAAADVERLGTFPADWTQQLVILRAYILTCIESTKASDDLFSVKLEHYQDEMKAALPQARMAQQAAEEAAGNVPRGGLFIVPLGRA